MKFVLKNAYGAVAVPNRCVACGGPAGGEGGSLFKVRDARDKVSLELAFPVCSVCTAAKAHAAMLDQPSGIGCLLHLLAVLASGAFLWSTSSGVNFADFSIVNYLAVALVLAALLVPPFVIGPLWSRPRAERVNPLTEGERQRLTQLTRPAKMKIATDLFFVKSVTLDFTDPRILGRVLGRQSDDSPDRVRLIHVVRSRAGRPRSPRHRRGPPCMDWPCHSRLRYRRRARASCRPSRAESRIRCARRRTSGPIRRSAWQSAWKRLYHGGIGRIGRLLRAASARLHAAVDHDAAINRRLRERRDDETDVEREMARTRLHDRHNDPLIPLLRITYDQPRRLMRMITERCGLGGAPGARASSVLPSWR